MKKTILRAPIALLLATVLSLSTAVGAFAKQIDPAPTGGVITIAWPGEGKDASPNIQAAIEKAKTAAKPVTLEFDQDKTYDVWPETSYHNTGYYVSNSATQGENPNGERFSAIFLKNMKDITIEGNNAMLMVHGEMTPILLDQSENIHFQNLHVDYKVPTVSELTILSKEGKTMMVSVNPSSLYQIVGGNRLQWVGENRPGTNTPYWSHYGGPAPVVEYNPDNGTCWRSSNPLSGATKIEDMGENKLKITFNGTPGGTIGRTFQYRDGVRDQVGSFIHMSKNVSFDNMGFHYMHGLGIVGQYSENLSFNNLDCTPREETGRTCASFADFIQISGCKGQVTVTDSIFKGAHDDIINVHGTHLRVMAKDDAAKKITVQFMHNQSWGFQAFNPGDKIEFINANSLIPYGGSNEVVSFNRLNNTQIELTLKNPLPAGITVGTDAVENVTYTPDVLIKGNFASAIPTRGILCTTRGKVVIEDNYFERTQMSGILLEDDARGWYESGLIQDMTIKNNTFDNCGGPVIFSNPQVASQDPNKTAHSNLSIIGNTFKGNAQIRAISTKNLIVEGNKFENGGSVSLSACNGFRVTDDNVGMAGGVSASNSLNDRSFASLDLEVKENITDIPRTGMTVTATTAHSSSPPTNLLDGNNGTIWHSDWTAPVIPDEISVTVNLNGTKTFNRFGYRPRSGELNGTITSYELYAKNGAEDLGLISKGSWKADNDVKYVLFDAPITATEIKLVAVEGVRDSSNRRLGSGAELYFQNYEKVSSELAIGRKIKLNMTAKGNSGMPTDLSDATFVYESMDPTIATVAQDGTITGIAPGTTNIKVTATLYGKTLSQTAPIQVSDELYSAAEEIVLTAPDSANGSTLQFGAEVTPAEAVSDIKWSVKTLAGGESIATVSNTGLLTVTGSGRILVEAYSDNDRTVRDSVMMTVTNDSITDTWTWVRESRSNWSVNEKNELSLKLQPGALWSGTTNTAKNIVTRDAGSEDFEVVTKMNYKPNGDYVEAGLIAYENDDNYVMLTRKKHSGFGGNIFAMITEKGGSPWESTPTLKVMDTVASKDIYLKLVKSGNNYSGYYSETGEDWKVIFENREVALGANTKVGLVGFTPVNAASETALFSYLEINGEKHTFEELLPTMYFEKTILSAVETPVVVGAWGASFEDLALPTKLVATWNETYTDTTSVVWDKSSYDADIIGTQTLTGELENVTDVQNPNGIAVTATVTLSVDPTDPNAYQARMKDVSAVTGSKGTEVILPFAITAFPTDAEYKAIEGVIEIPEGLTITKVEKSVNITAQDPVWHQDGRTLRFAFASIDEKGTPITFAQGSDNVLVHLTATLDKDFEEDTDLTLTTTRFLLRASDGVEKMYGVAGAKPTISIKAPIKQTVTASLLFTSGGELIPAGKKAVSFAFTGVTSDETPSYKGIELSYSSQRSETHNQVVYVAFVAEGESEAALGDIANFTFDAKAPAQLVFGNTDEYPEINAQDALNVLSAWLRKIDISADDNLALAMNVSADNSIDTQDAIGIVDNFISSRPFVVVEK